MTKKVKLLLVSFLIILVVCVFNISYSFHNMISSFDYKILNNVIYAVPTSFEFKVGELLNNINYVGEVSVYDIDKKLLNEDDVVGTGSTLTLNNVTYNIVVLGDVTGDGLIEIGDVSKLYNHFRGNKTFDGINLEAGMLTDSQSIAIGDISKLYNYYRGKKAFTYYSYNLYSMLLDKKVNVKLINDSETNISNGYIKYNSVLVPMDEVLSNMLDNYDLSNIREYTYKDKTFKIDLDNKYIVFEDVRIIDSFSVNSSTGVKTPIKETVDYSIYVDIENINNVNYIPIHFLAYFDNVGITVDNRNVYNGENYLRAIDAININSDDCDVVINLKYDGEAFNELWKEEAYKRIEKYRKEEVKVVVKDKDGNLLKNGKVELNMVSNDFKFGNAVVYDQSKKKNDYTGITNDYFNTVGSENGFKWPMIHSQYHSKNARDVTDYGKEHNMYVRGHCLWWDLATSSELKAFVGSLDNLQEGTMAYVYNQYNNGSITLDEANALIDELIVKFENIVLAHIEDELSMYMDVDEWDVTNELSTNQFFKHYLYDRKFLNENAFLTDKGYAARGRFILNLDYERFIARVFDKVRELNPNAVLVYNDNPMNSAINSGAYKESIKIVNRIKQFTNNLDKYGVQYHVQDRYFHTPQAYNNQINAAANEMDVHDFVISEYDNYTSSSIGTYSDEEKNEKAEYLYDTLIGAYSNVNINEFIFWGITNDHFVDEERDAYNLLIKEWLHDKKNGSSDKSGEYVTNLHKGQYNLEVKYGNKTKQQLIIVKDNMDIIEVVID